MASSEEHHHNYPTNDSLAHQNSCFQEGVGCDSCWPRSTGNHNERPSKKGISVDWNQKRKRQKVSELSFSDDDAELVNHMNDLSMKEREGVFEEIHGVAKITTETPEFLVLKYSELDEELKSMHKSYRKAYNRAVFLKPSLEYDRAFQLMFLRADRFDIKLAAKRLVNFFESKLVLFGDEKLVKVITLEDLSVDEDDIEAVQFGFMHILPHKDRAGRSIVFFAPSNFRGKNWKSCARCHWYQFMVHLREDVQSQIHGFVAVSYSLDIPPFEKDVFQYHANSAPLNNMLPARICSIHVCSNNMGLKRFVQLGQTLFSKDIGIRFRYHFGSSTEVIYILMTFGIPMTVFPIKMDGSVSYDYYFRYLESRHGIEKEAERRRLQRQSEENVVEYPNHRKDVLIGRGKPYHGFPGNAVLSEIARKYVDQYKDTTEHLGKMCILMEIASKLTETGGRFLHRTAKGWELATEKMTQAKVRSVIRSILKS